MRIKDTNTGTRIISGQATSGRKTRDLLASEDSTISMPMVVVVTAGAGSGTVQDAMLSWPETKLTTNDVNVSVPPDGYSTGPITYSSSNTAVATIDSSGNVTPQAAGTTLITVTIPGLNGRLVLLDVVQTGGPTDATFEGFVTGSLGAHLVGQVNTLIGSQTPPSGLPLVNPPTHPPPSGTNVNIFLADGISRNSVGGSGVWTGTLDLTCIPINNIPYMQGVLIAPDTVAVAHHVGTPPPQMTFVDSSNVAYTRAVSNYYLLSSPCGDGGDIYIGQLASPVPPSITPAQLMPADFSSYLPQPQYRYPLVFTNQDKTILVGDLIKVEATSPFDLVQVQPADPTRAPWWYAVRDGDSGNPVFHVIDIGTGPKLVLATLWHTMSVGTAAGPIYADNLDQIRAVMTIYESPYTITTVDLSGFTAY